MEKILESIWMVAVLVAGWFGARLTKQIDDLSKEKADSSEMGVLRSDYREEYLSQGKLIHELDRRIDESKHTSIGRVEYKEDISAIIEKINKIHERINSMSEKKADKILNYRVHQSQSKEKNGET